MLKLKLCPSDVKDWLIWKDPDTGKDWRQKKKGMSEDEMVGWHHQLNGHEFKLMSRRTGRPGVLESMGLQRVGHDWATELNWTDWVQEVKTVCDFIFKYNIFTLFERNSIQFHIMCYLFVIRHLLRKKNRTYLSWILWLLKIQTMVCGSPFVHAKLLWSCPTLFDPWTIACQAPLPMGFSRQETGVGCHVLLHQLYPCPQVSETFTYNQFNSSAVGAPCVW